MKTHLLQKANSVLLIALGLALVTLGVLTMCDSCAEPLKPQTTEVVVRFDVTEPHQPVPEAENILKLYELDNDPSRGAVFRFSFISDLQLNEETVFALPASAQNVLTNQFDREREIAQFIKEVTDFLNSLAMDTIGREQSALYVPIANTLNTLAQSTADRKILLLYSDMRENTSRISFYDKRTLTLMQTDSSQVAALLEAQEPLHQLLNVDVFMLYQSRDVSDDASFAIVSRFYRGLLTSKGAEVVVAANLNP